MPLILLHRQIEVHAQISEEDEDLLAYIWSLHVDNRGKHYARRSEGGRRLPRVRIYMHRVIMLRIAPPPTPKHIYVDHINWDGLDNRRANLRWATASENAKNTARLLGGEGGPYQEHVMRAMGLSSAPIVHEEPTDAIPF